MEVQYEQTTFAVEENHWWYRGRRSVIAEFAEKAVNKSTASILDVGCGSGRNMQLLSQYGSVSGVDPSPAAVKAAQARGLSQTQVATATQLPHSEKTFDLITAFDVIEHIDNDVEALQEFRRVGTSTGRLLVTVPAYQWLWSSHDEVNFHIRRYNKKQLQKALALAGWNIDTVTYFNTFLFPFAILQRLLDRARQSEPQPDAALKIPRRNINRLFESVLCSEAKLIHQNTSFPFGLSLAALCHKANV